MVVSEKLDKFFTEKMKEYPTQRSFLVPMLLYTQDELGYLSDEAIAYAAQKTGLTELEVRNVISYYSMLHTRPMGKHHVQVCTNISCLLRGGEEVLEHYLGLDGYKAVQKALKMKPDEIINEVKISNLRGRGGAGFPTGMKWSFVPKESAKPKYVLLNGDESEPGTCKDRLILEQDPHSVIEGVVIAGLAVGAQVGYIYIRGEYRYLVDIMRKALADAYARGFLGKNIFGSGREFNVYWHTGAGAYEVGEESALMESLEGKRGIPRIRPPFPAVVGLWGGPTVINNVETLASVPHIILDGGQKFADLGVPKNGGTRLFCLSGHISKPGVDELPLGSPR